MRKRLFAGGLLLIAAISAIAASTAGASTKGDQLVGAGSTFVLPLVSQWQKDYPSKTGVNIVYSGTGSGAGIAAISSRTIDFGASDAPLTPDQASGCKDCFQIPWALGGVAIMLHVHTNAHAPIKMSGPVLAQIYLGGIKNWNAPAIAKLNPGITFPNEAIVPVYRSDGSGTSYAFTDYLSAVSGTWKSKIGFSTQPAFPTGVGAKGSSGVAGAVSKTEGAIGYADIAYALSQHIPTASVKNAAGKFTTPGIASIGAAAAAFPKVPANNEMHITNPPKSAPKAYPICTYTYVIIPHVTPKAALLKKFVFYALTTGQKFGIPLRYVPIPKTVLSASEKTLAQIHS
jgi:phosphate transport system substrate-binding protein